MVEYLVLNQANINAVGAYSLTPLHLSASENRSAVVKLLIDSGAKVDAVELLEDTPLHMAASRGFPAIVKMILEKSSPELKKVQNKEGNTPLHMASQGCTTEAIQTWIKVGGKVGQQLIDDYSEVVRLLAERGQANLEAKNKAGSTPLHLAASTGNLYLIELLLELGAEEQPKDDNGNTLFQVQISQNIFMTMCQKAESCQVH